MLRPLVIAFVVLTHIPAALYRPDLRDVELGPATFLSAWISGVIALAALPTLSVISGYLATFSFARRSYPRFAISKFRRLAIPMVLWGLPSALLIYYRQSMGLPFRPDLDLYPFDLEAWARALTALGKLPANPPLYFLRELLVSALLIPAWSLVARSHLASLALGMGILYCSLTGIHFGFFHRIDICLYFFAGVYLARHPEVRRMEPTLRRYTGWITALLLVYAAGLALYAFSGDASLFQQATQVVRLAGPLALWLLSGALLSSAASRFLIKLEPASYTVFLGHSPCILLLWETWRRLFGFQPFTWTYLVFTLTMLALSFAMLWALWKAYRAGRDRLLHTGTPP